MPNKTAVAVVCLLLAGALPAQDVDRERLQSEAVARLQGYIRLDTTNPPGNETLGVEYLAGLLDAEGIDYQTAESAPRRGNLWARLEGGTLPALVLLHHIDVVPADSRYWTMAPLSGEIRDGYLYGRGAQDTKGLGIMQLQAFIALHRAGKLLNRPVVYVATADEEAGGAMGAGWLVENHPEIFADAAWLLNEGGGGIEFDGHGIVQVEVTQKVPLWLRVTAKDRPGHGSTPGRTSAVTRLIAALGRIAEYDFTPRILPVVDAYAKARSAAGAGPYVAELAHLATAVRSEDFQLELRMRDPSLSALTTNTCSITRLQGSSKINVVPPQASADIDCRLLPDEDPDQFLERLATIINDPAVLIEELMRFSPAMSSTDTELYSAIRGVSAQHYPDAAVIPTMASGFTDSHFFRDIGMIAYGYSPAMWPQPELRRIHGNDERISVENLHQGTLIMLDLLERLVYATAEPAPPPSGINGDSEPADAPAAGPETRPQF